MHNFGIEYPSKIFAWKTKKEVSGGNKKGLYKKVSENGRCTEDRDQIIYSGFDISGVELSNPATMSLGICVCNPEIVTLEANFISLLALGRVQIFYIHLIVYF